MHYRNGRQAQNGDKIVQLDSSGRIAAIGVLYDAVPGNDYCNGSVAPINGHKMMACLVDCLHIDDVDELIKKAQLSSRPAGK